MSKFFSTSYNSNEKNRRPNKSEIRACIPLLKKEIDIIEPKIIITLGSIPLHALIGNDHKLSKISGKRLIYEQKILFPTFHPAAAMRFPKYGKKFKQDFDILQELLNNF